MKLVSTRDETSTPLGYREVLLAGLAPDGGLYVPSEFPTVSPEILQSLMGKTYAEVSFAIKRLLVAGDIPDDVLSKLINEAYSQTNFPESKAGNVTPVRSVRPGLYLQNLSLGPTAAFKDMAMQLLGHEMNHELQKQNQHLRILGATSGDTGSAAEAAMKGLENITLYMLSPDKGMSAFQKSQMGELTGGNIFNISITGRFDDCQDMVKEMKTDPEFSDLGAVNSINWGRISSQVPYYFSGYLQAVERVSDEVDFVVPSGNFGNVYAGFVAKKMGLPIRRLIVATNENEVLHRLFTTGEYQLTAAQVTSSPSMDISKASNYERLVFDLFDNDAGKTAKYMNEFAKSGTVDFKDFGLVIQALKDRGFVSGASSETMRLNSIKWVYETAGIVIDPHTADGVTVAREYFDEKENVPMICLETALPVKFEETIKNALGFVPERPVRFREIESINNEEAFVVMDTDLDNLKNFVRDNSKLLKI